MLFWGIFAHAVGWWLVCQRGALKLKVEGSRAAVGEKGTLAATSLAHPTKKVNYWSHRWELIVLWFIDHIVLAGVHCVCTHRCCCVRGRETNTELESQEERDRVERGREIQMKFEKFASHLALSLPWDLIKFMSLYFDRKATSWLLVLKEKNITCLGETYGETLLQVKHWFAEQHELHVQCGFWRKMNP